MKIRYMSNFKFEIKSNRIFFDKYEIGYKECDNECIAYIVGKGKENRKKETFNDYALLKETLTLGEYIIKSNIKDITKNNMVIVDNVKIRDDKKNEEEYQKIIDKVIQYISKYGLSITEEDNQLNRIIEKIYMIYKINCEWEKNKNIINDISNRNGQTKEKFNISLNSLSSKLNGNMLDSPIKPILQYDENDRCLCVYFYSTSITSISNYQLMLHISEGNEMSYNICKYCKSIIQADDKRVICCEREVCKKKHKNEEIQKYREKERIIKKLVDDIINSLDDINKKKFIDENKEYRGLVSRKKVKKEEYMAWLMNWKG